MSKQILLPGMVGAVIGDILGLFSANPGLLACALCGSIIAIMAWEDTTEMMKQKRLADEAERNQE